MPIALKNNYLSYTIHRKEINPIKIKTKVVDDTINKTIVVYVCYYSLMVVLF